MPDKQVLIRGHAFSYDEKAPFVISGKSIMGALEYDFKSEKIKCHECGEWFEHISATHLVTKHDMTSASYKYKHGLNQTTSLSTPLSTIKRRENCNANITEEARAVRTARLVEAGKEYRKLGTVNASHRTRQLERENAVSRCQAQSLFRIQVLAAQLGRTPHLTRTRGGQA